MSKLCDFRVVNILTMLCYLVAVMTFIALITGLFYKHLNLMWKNLLFRVLKVYFSLTSHVIVDEFLCLCKKQQRDSLCCQQAKSRFWFQDTYSLNNYNLKNRISIDLRYTLNHSNSFTQYLTTRNDQTMSNQSSFLSIIHASRNNKNINKSPSDLSELDLNFQIVLHFAHYVNLEAVDEDNTTWLISMCEDDLNFLALSMVFIKLTCDEDHHHKLCLLVC